MMHGPMALVTMRLTIPYSIQRQNDVSRFSVHHTAATKSSFVWSRDCPALLFRIESRYGCR